MGEAGVLDRLREAFPALARDPGLPEALAGAGERRAFDPGAALFGKGSACAGIGLFLAGSARVFAAGARGREITLYEILPGELCILNAACVLSRRRYPAEARVLEAAEIVVLPAERFRGLFQEREALREYVLGLFADRLALTMELVEEVAFGGLERRLDDYLVERAEDGVVRLTHLAIANDLGTSREVVSRVLKDMERRGRLRLGRSEIRLAGPGA